MSLPGFENLSAASCLIGLATAAAFTAFLYDRFWAAPNLTRTNGLSLPPGPPARWFWENALPCVKTAHTLAEWVAEYGPVFTLRQGSQVIIIIGRVDAAKEIMEKEGGALVDRPRSSAAGELAPKGLWMLLIRTGERLRRFRKAIHAHLQPRAIGTYQELQLGHAKEVVVDILNDPRNHMAHVQRYAASVILRLTYGKLTPTLLDDPEVVRIQQVMKNFQHVMRPGAFLVDRIPLLKYLPGYGNQLRQYHEFEIRLYRDLISRVESEMEMNVGGNSFAKALLENGHEYPLSRDELAYLSGNLFHAGTETSAVALTNIILATACHPEAQKGVQEELDVVVGKDRMPTWQDSESLPQVHAFVSETLRWRPVMPMGFAHRATQNIFWRVYRFLDSLVVQPIE